MAVGYAIYRGAASNKRVGTPALRIHAWIPQHVTRRYRILTREGHSALAWEPGTWSRPDAQPHDRHSTPPTDTLHRRPGPGYGAM